MSNKKDKAKWQHQQEVNKKTCFNCSQLAKDCCGQYLCRFAKSKKEFERGGGVILKRSELNHPKLCFDKYNGLNLI